METRPTARRRAVLRGLAASGPCAFVSGCLDDLLDDGTGQRTPTESPPDDAPFDDPEIGFDPTRLRVEDPPDAVYRPTHRESMRTLEPIVAGDYRVTPMLTYAHAFWLVADRSVTVVEPRGDDVHLGVTICDDASGLALPVDGVTLDVFRGAELVTQVTAWRMLSQGMGLHHGDNVPLDGDGVYEVRGRIPAPGVRRAGAFAGRFDEPVEFSFAFTFDDDFRRAVVEGVEYLDEREWGTPGALEPAEHATCAPLAPTDALPGTLQGTPSSADAVFATTLLGPDAVARGDTPESGFPADAPEEGWYLAVSPRTPYNRWPLPAMTLEGTITPATGSTTSIELHETIDDRLGHHYGGWLPAIESGDEVTIDVISPSQVARHQGYEMAFVDVPSVRVVIDP